MNSIQWNGRLIRKIGVIVLTIAAIIAIVWLGTALSKANKALAEETEGKPTAIVVTTAEPAAQPQPTQDAAVIPARMMNTASAQVAIGAQVVRLGTEHETWTLSGLQEPASARCPQGFLCTLATESGVKVFIGEDELTEKVYGGTFRFISSFPEDDAVQESACALLDKERDFASQEVPSFEVNAGNFDCPK